jgi:hypothetical protein
MTNDRRKRTYPPSSRRPKQVERDYYDGRYQQSGIQTPLTKAGTVPILAGSVVATNLKNELYVTVGDRRQNLPNSSPTSYLGADVSPDSGNWDLGNITNQWKRLWINRFILRNPTTGEQVSYDLNSWMENIGQKLASSKILLAGYGAHNFYDEKPYGTVWIERMVSFNKDRTYTTIKNFSMNGWWSATDIDNLTGLGIKRECVDGASALAGGVEVEMDDFGSEKYIVCRFRNFNKFRVVAGVNLVV